MRRLFAGYLCALLVFSLAACNSAAEPTPSPTNPPTATPSPSPTPSAQPTPSLSTAPDPITGESLRESADFAEQEIYEIFTDGDHFLVWYGEKGSVPATGRSDLTWVDGRTGARYPLPRLSTNPEIISGVTVDWSWGITVSTSGVSYITGWRSMPISYLYVPGEDGRFTCTADPWADVETPVTLGVKRAAVVADARAGVNDVAVVFVPPANEKGLSNFIAGATYIPQVETRYDKAENVFYVTVRDTALQSGEFQAGGEDWVYDYMRDVGLSYPYNTPMGSLGKDNRFFTSAAISSDGTDTTITLRLTEHAQRYTVQVEHLGQDMFPTLRLVFAQDDSIS